MESAYTDPHTLYKNSFSATQPHKNHLKRKSFFMIVFVMLLFISFFLGLFYVIQNVEQRTKINTQENQQCNKEYIYQTSVLYGEPIHVNKATQDHIALSMNSVPYFEHLHQKYSNILSIFYNQITRNVVFLAGDKPEMNPNGKITAYMYNSQTKNDQKILEYKNVVLNETQSPLVDFLDHASFSEDGSIITLTSLFNVWEYNVKTQQLQKVYSHPKIEVFTSHDFMFDSSITSPNMKHTFLALRMYEGNVAGIFNRQTKKISKLPLSTNFVYGNTVLGWYKDSLVARTYDGKKDAFCLYTITGEELKCIADLTQLQNATDIRAKIFNHHILYVVTQIKDETQTICEKSNQKITTEYQTLYDLEIETGELRKILTVDSTLLPGSNESVHQIRNFSRISIDEDPVVVIELFDNGLKYVIPTFEKDNEVSELQMDFLKPYK